MGAGVNVPRINERFMGMRPSGYLTDDDNAFLERALSRGTENIGAGVQQSQGLAAARLAQRRIGGAAAEDVLGGIAGQGGLARARLAGGVADIGAGIYQGNRRFEQGKVMTAWNAELAARARYDHRREVQRAAWGNAVGSLAKTVGSFYGGGIPGADVSAPGAGYGAADNYGAALPDGY